jgi:hypothetical protein
VQRHRDRPVAALVVFELDHGGEGPDGA